MDRQIKQAEELSILEITRNAAAKDRQMVTTEGKPVGRLTEGVRFKELPTHVDERGTVFEMFDPRWDWHPEPLVFAYSLTIRPGYAKGWNLHELHEDRYFILQGEMALILYDPRPESATCGEVCKIVLSSTNRRLVNVPRRVWHADWNIGSTDVMIVNFPTMAYDHANPDKWRLPLDTDLIPYRFDAVKGY
jgi:dTDP-4-dehydrorhamnose 3,5-epimerase